MRLSFPAPPLHSQLLDAGKKGWAWELRKDHMLLGIGGVWPLSQSSEIAAIYFVGTPAADENPIYVYKACRGFVRYQHRTYHKLGNIVPLEMGKRIKWLKSLGFDMDWENEHFRQHGCLSFWHTKRPDH